MAGGRTIDVTGRDAAFATPSGNITCSSGRGDGPQAFVRCDVQTMSWPPPRKPADCDNDWGIAVTLEVRAAFACVGDTVGGLANLGEPGATSWFHPGVDPVATTVLDPSAGLGYGSTMISGRLRCTSERQGLTCRNTRTGAGFFLSRERYRLMP